MNNNQNYGPNQGQPNVGYQQPQPGAYQTYAYQEPPKKGLSTGCVVALVIAIILGFTAIVGGILFVCFGAMLFNNAKDVTGSNLIESGIISELDEIGAELYNAAFDMYTGNDKTNRSVANIMGVVRANNEDEKETNIVNVRIELKNGTVLDYSTYDNTMIPEESKYIIEASKGPKGYINKIDIFEK